MAHWSGQTGRTRHSSGRTSVRRTCIQAAVDFVAAQDDGPERALARHRRRPDGTCAGCRHAPTPWPCTTAIIARLAAGPS